MLNELRVRNYAVIDDLRLDLGPGLNVLTGETGAGKSLIVGALGLLLGERASSDVVRAGEEAALVEGVFDLSALPELAEKCREQGIEPEDGWLILRREVLREGRNRAWVNGSPATAGLIGRLGERLVDLHGQHEHQALLARDAQRQILDAFAGAGKVVTRVAESYARWTALRSRISAGRERAAAIRERAEFLEFRAREIEAAALEPGEEDALRSEARRLEHSEELLELASSLYEAVYGQEGAIVEATGALSRPVNELVRIDPEAADVAEIFTSIRTLLTELGTRLERYRGTVEHDPHRLAEVRERLELIHRLKRKHGGSIEDVLEVGRAARAELDEADRSVFDLEALSEEADAARHELLDASSELSALRRDAAERLEVQVTDLLQELGMEGGRFRVRFMELEEPGAHGAEKVEFEVGLNVGFDPGPLARVASGGELSRVMLALKSVLAAVDGVPSLVFDEIDAGVGGQVALRVAERLAHVAEKHQVFVVTHLPQIASRASIHLRVEKTRGGDIASATVTKLEGEARVEELARMLGGDPDREASRRHAAELLSE